MSLTCSKALDNVVQRDTMCDKLDFGPAHGALASTVALSLPKTAGAEGVATAEGGCPVEHLQADGTLQLAEQAGLESSTRVVSGWSSCSTAGLRS